MRMTFSSRQRTWCAATWKIDTSSSSLLWRRPGTSSSRMRHACRKFSGAFFATLASSRRKTARFRCGLTILTQRRSPSRSVTAAWASNHNLSKESLIRSNKLIRGAKVSGSVSRLAKQSSKCTGALFVHAAKDKAKAQPSSSTCLFADQAGELKRDVEFLREVSIVRLNAAITTLQRHCPKACSLIGLVPAVVLASAFMGQEPVLTGLACGG